MKADPANSIPVFQGQTAGGPQRSATKPEPWIQAMKEPGSSPQQFDLHVRNFLDCIKSRQTPIADVEEGHHTAVACHLANISLRLGRRVHWDAEKETITGDKEAAAMLRPALSQTLGCRVEEFIGMTRRTFLITAAAGSAASALGAAPRTKFGIATTSYMTVRRFRDTYEFLEHCNGLGAPGIQAALSSTDPAYLKKVRGRAEQLGMYVEVMAPMPKADSGEFERYVQAAKDVGAVAIRTGCLGGRRYETFRHAG